MPEHAGRWPLTAAQEGIWTGQRLDPASAAYLIAERVDITGPIDTAVFAAAVRRTLAETGAVAVRFGLDAGDRPVQHPVEVPDQVLEFHDVSGAADPVAAADAVQAADLARPVDPAADPLYRHVLFRLADDEYRWYHRVHHLALDGYGLALVARRVAEVYTALLAGAPVPPTAFRPFTDVLAEDAEYRGSDRAERDRAYWTGRFADRPEPVTLSARRDPAAGTVRRATGELPPETAAALRRVARAAGAGWPEVLLAATAGYLHRQTGAAEVVLGVPVMNRLGSAALRVPAMVMNVVPVRVPVAPGATLTDLTATVAAELRAGRPHQRHRYEQLRRDLRLVGGGRGLTGPAVNVMPFEYGLSFAGHPGTVENVAPGPVEDLTVAVFDRADGTGARLCLDANPDRYDAAALDAHRAGLLDLLAAATADPDRPLAARPAPGAGLLDGGPLPAPARPVLSLIAAHDPGRTAVEHDGTRLTYGELLGAAGAVAGRLAAAGVGRGDRVAVLLPRGVDAVTAILGTLLAGAAYVPVDPAGPRSRTAAVLADARPAATLTTTRYAGAAAGPALCLDDPAWPAPAAHPVPEPTGDDPAYLIYTSGSTGRPNGVVVGHRALATFVAGATARYRIGAGDRVLQFAPLHFDASVEEIFLTLCAGATLVVRTDAMTESPAALTRACDAARITVLDLPTAYWHELAYALSTGSATRPATVRTVVIGGEAALAERVQRWHAAVGDRIRLLNTYGPTETTVVATTADLTGEPGEPPIGTPLPGMRAVLIGPGGHPVPAGVHGELHLIGDALAEGYHGRPELTAARFVTLPQLPGAPRAYRTGDRAVLGADGSLRFAGRVDDEFKISGHRVDPAEVESVLLRHAGVRDVAVVGQVFPDGTRRLTAYVVAGTPDPLAAQLRAHAREHLPAALVPSRFEFTDRLPTTGSGKVDRSALRAAVPVVVLDRAADSATERLVRSVWAEVLGVADPRPDDDFFELGGQSLQTIQVANRLGAALGREVGVALLFRHPTVAALAAALDETPAGGAAGAAGPAGDTVAADARLGTDVVPARVTPATAAPNGRTAAGRVVLTGATGFVGRHLLAELLATGAEVVCLVRADDDAHARDRLLRATPAAADPRVVAVAADLTRPRLGLSAERFAALADACDAVYHNAAVVSVLRSYASLRPANVEGTREVLRLAATGRPSAVHYVSTVNVAQPPALAPALPEAFLPRHAGLVDGYQQSKWVAERLVEQAGERGLPVSVYRLGRVVGPADTGYVNADDVLWRVLREAIPAGQVPELYESELWTPVDYVARAITHLSAGPPGVFNLTPAAPVRLSRLCEWIGDYGFPVELRPLSEWLTAANGRAGADATTMAFFDLWSGTEHAGATLRLGPVVTDAVRRGLAGTGIECPPVTRQLVHRYLDYCVSHGLLPRPATLVTSGAAS